VHPNGTHAPHWADRPQLSPRQLQEACGISGGYFDQMVLKKRYLPGGRGPRAYSLRDLGRVCLLRDLQRTSAHLPDGNIGGVNEGIVQEALRALDAVIDSTPEGGPVPRRTFCVPRLNSPTRATIRFDLGALVERLISGRSAEFC
jgi:hypothetical protein